MSKVLVIDDEKMILGLLEQVLSRADFHVETVDNGKSGLEKFDQGEFDLVITDVCMPEVDGKQVVSYIKNSDRKHTPVIGMSGTPWRLQHSNFDEIIPKPFELKKLVKTAKSLIPPEYPWCEV